MTRRLLTLIFTALMLAMCPAAADAQNLKFDIVKFELNQLDGTASNAQYRKVDGSGNLYAVIKVRSTDGDEGLGEFMFNFNSLKSIVEDKGDELWVYVQKNAKIVTISREGYTPLRNFDLKTTLQAGKTYNMEITYDRVEKVVKKELRMQMVCFKITPAVEGAIVMYKKEGQDKFELLGQTDNQGFISKNLNFGTYEYQVFSQKHFTSEGIVKLNNSDEVHTENITLKSNTSEIILVTNADADIYVDNEFKGRGRWNGTLKAGEYTVECKQQDHISTNQKIVIEVSANKTIELMKPTPITGFVSVTSSPSGATVLIDGKERGKTPCNISDVLVGNRKVTLYIEGYAQGTKEVVVKEGEVTDVNLTLEKGTTQKQFDTELEDICNKGKQAYDKGNYTEAVKYFTKAAEQGHTEAQYYLAEMYDNGVGISVGFSEATKGYIKTAKKGNANAQWMIGFCYEYGYGVRDNPKKAINWYRKAAEQGHVNAQWRIGHCYEFGTGVTKNITEAVKWYTKAAEQGLPNMQYDLANCYKKGIGVAKDIEEAVKWYRKAAEQGYATAQYKLGYCYEKGQGVTQDYAEAVKYYKEAAGLGNEEAQYQLGTFYEIGFGVDKNLTEAVKWYRKAAEQGDEYAQKALERLATISKTTTKKLSASELEELNLKGWKAYNNKNYTEAVKWYRKAAEQGDAYAQYCLGVCYERGEGVEKNYTEAVKWYKKAAEQGDKDAQKTLERLQK